MTTWNSRGKTHLADHVIRAALGTGHQVLVISGKPPYQVIRSGKVVPGQVVTDSGELENGSGDQ